MCYTILTYVLLKKGVSCCMAKQIDLQIKESEVELKHLLPKQNSITKRIRIKMLLLM